MNPGSRRRRGGEEWGIKGAGNSCWGRPAGLEGVVDVAAVVAVVEVVRVLGVVHSDADLQLAGINSGRKYTQWR